MTQEEKELLLKDLCGRLPYGVIGEYSWKGKKPYNRELTGNLYDELKSSWDSTEDSKFLPYLRPMSSMTEEEAKEIAILHDIKDVLSVKVTSDYIDVIVDDWVCSTERRTIWYDEIVSSVKCFDFLTAHHFDYRGLIEKRLAITVTEENNPYKE